MWDDAGIDPHSSNDGPSFPLPPQAAFERLGLRVSEELHGGFQSRILRAQLNGHDVAVKLIDTNETQATHAVTRMRVLDQVSHRDDRVVPLLPIAGRKLQRIDQLLVTASPYIDGDHPDKTRRSDVERMARALARLHESLRLVQVDLPVHLGLQAGDPSEAFRENAQLLHGDFAAQNLLFDGDGRLWIYDFDDCGYGPVEFEIGNSLFMTLFDTSPSLNQPSAEYRQFRHWFVGAYRDASNTRISESLIDLGVQTRAAALRHWITNLDAAPRGIRNSTPAWRHKLAAFAGTITLPTSEL